MEATPRALELRGDDIVQTFHAYGTNGIIVEIEMPLTPVRLAGARRPFRIYVRHWNLRIRWPSAREC